MLQKPLGSKSTILILLPAQLPGLLLPLCKSWAWINPPAGRNPGKTTSAELVPSPNPLLSSREPPGLEHPAHVAGPRGRWAEVGRGWDAAKGALLARAPNPAPSHSTAPTRLLNPLSTLWVLLGSSGRLELGSSYRQDDVALPWSCQSLSQAQLRPAGQRGRIQPPNSKCSHSSCPSPHGMANTTVTPLEPFPHSLTLPWPK